MKKSVTGVVVFLRSEGKGAEDCACCEGGHVYGSHIELDQRGEPRPYPGLVLEDVDDFINDTIHSAEWEGRRVRVSIEAID